METKYYCEECSAPVQVYANLKKKTCDCEAAIIASANVSVKGISGTGIVN